MIENIEPGVGIEFGPVTKQVLFLTRDFDLQRGPASLSPDALATVQDLYRTHIHPTWNAGGDPVREGLAYRRLQRLFPPSDVAVQSLRSPSRN
jgi:hypothetical protein